MADFKLMTSNNKWTKPRLQLTGYKARGSLIGERPPLIATRVSTCSKSIKDFALVNKPLPLHMQTYIFSATS